MPSHESGERKRFRASRLVAAGVGVLALTAVAGGVIALRTAEHESSGNASPSAVRDSSPEQKTGYPVHENITATVFWVGEGATEDNKFIHNRSSTWDEQWMEHYGGVDDPSNRCDYKPCSFTPKENPFYFALPYSDQNEDGSYKDSAKQVPWYTTEAAASGSSLVKNRWVKITYQGRTAYAQWEDAGPYGEDDFDYVFGSKKPSAPEAGIDLSPSTADYLGVDGRGTVSWQFMDEKSVPSGPWRNIITTD